MTALDCDVVVVGSGAAGGTLAATLAERGRRVVLLEKGPHYDHTFFDQRELDMNVLRAENGGRTTEDGAYPVQSGECVGGGTTVNYALCFDPVPAVWKGWRERSGVNGFSFDASAADYGVPGLNVPRALADVRRRINVHTAEDWMVNDNNRLFAAGARKRGVAVKRFELNMRGCVGSGFCGQGCSYDAKRGTLVTYVPDAVKHGVQLVHHCDVEQVRFSRSGAPARATGITGTVRPTVHGSLPNSVAPGPIAVRAKLVVLAAGAVGTPVILQRSKYHDPDDVVGRGVVLHPSLPVGGVFEHPVVNYRNVTGTYYSDAFRDSHGFVLECLFDHPVDTSLALPSFGRAHFDVMRDYRKLGGFGVMLIDTPQHDNRVIWDADAKKPVIRWALGENDKPRLRFGARTGVEIMLAAGARSAFLTSDERLGDPPRAVFHHIREAAACSRLTFRPHSTLLASAHIQASTKMGASPRTSVADGRGETHHARNLVICDASSFPTSCGANPMISIMTMARYQGLRIAAEWHSRYTTTS